MDKEELENLHAELEKTKEQLRAETSAVAKNPAEVKKETIEKIEQLRAAKANLESVIAAGKELGAKPTTQTVPVVPQVQERAGKKTADPNIKVTKDETDNPFKSMGEQLRAVARFHNYGERDERLDWVNNKAEREYAVSGMGENMPSNGGFMIQRDFAVDLMGAGYDNSKLAPKCKKIPLSTNANGLELVYIDETSRATGSRFGGVQIYWGNEADAATAKKPKLGSLKIDLGKLIACAYASDEVLEDASALGAVIKMGFEQEFAFVLDDTILRGDGVGKPLGILNAGCLVTQAKESSQTADTVNTQNILKMYSQSSNMAAAEWYINQEVTVQLPQLTLLGGTSSAPLFMPPNGMAGAPLGTLYGRPINVLEQCSAIGDVGDIIFADFSQYGLIDKGGLQAASSMHVRFLNSEQTFRFTYRVGGQPLRKVAKTAYKGAITPSPFVVLEAR